MWVKLTSTEDITRKGLLREGLGYLRLGEAQYDGKRYPVDDIKVEGGFLHLWVPRRWKNLPDTLVCLAGWLVVLLLVWRGKVRIPIAMWWLGFGLPIAVAIQVIGRFLFSRLTRKKRIAQLENEVRGLATRADNSWLNGNL